MRVNNTPPDTVRPAIRGLITQGDGISLSEHEQVCWHSPCVPSSDAASALFLAGYGVQISARLIRKAVSNGELPAFKIGHGYQFRPRDLNTWLESRRVNS